MKAKKLIFFRLALIFFFITIVYFALILIPSFALYSTDRYINDSTGIIDSSTIKKITILGNEIEQRTGAQIKVEVIRSKGDTSIEEYAVNLFRSLGLGEEDKDNGILILVATEDKEMRIEVGYGLEGIIPDGKAGRIRDTYMIPYFKKGDYSKGIYNGYLAIVSEIAKHQNITINLDERYIEQHSNEVFEKMKTSAFIFLFLFGLTFVFALLSGRLRFGIGSSQSSEDSRDGGSTGGGGASGKW